MLLYDNIDDVKTKLLGTYVYHEGHALIIKDVGSVEPNKYVLYGLNLNARQKKIVYLDDPKLNFMKYNLGYTNHGHSAVWWCRTPNRQYRQGLKADQVRPVASHEAYLHRVEFQFNRPVVDMLENIYPKFEEIEKPLKDRSAEVLAFNKDFAASWDRVHQDIIIEYKGKTIGCTEKNGFKLMEEYTHLTEALKEAVA